MRAVDPFLLYQLGRDLVIRQFTLDEGAYGRAGELTVPLYATGGASGPSFVARFARDHTSSCAACHSIPAREPGGGQTIASTSGMGRNSGHFFGSGLVEMLAEQVRQRVLNTYDLNRNGLIDRDELRTSMPVRIEPLDGGPPVNYGDLSPGVDGMPRLNSGFRVWFVDASHSPVPDAKGLLDPRVAAFDFALQPFGWGRGIHMASGDRAVTQGAEATTLRGIYAVAADVHMGLQAFDPSQMRPTRVGDAAAPAIGGTGQRSLSGALQFDLGEAVDRGRRRASPSVSLDDPDGDGHVTELSEGDIDAAEFYMLHAPAPAVLRTPAADRGRQRLRAIGCVRCHVEQWQIERRDSARGFAGDRRLFRIEPESTGSDGDVPEVRLRLLWQSRSLPDGRREPVGAPFLVRSLYSDLKHWDIGPAFYERRFDGTLQREHRTAPLWGVGSTAPYGHAGQFLTLDAVIRNHGGAAADEARRYARLGARARAELIAGLESLVLYQTDQLRADINRDGRFGDRLSVDGVDVGYERFDPRFLFRTPARLRILYWVVDAHGRRVPLATIENITEAYGLSWSWRKDSDGDGFADLARPLVPGKVRGR